MLRLAIACTAILACKSDERPVSVDPTNLRAGPLRHDRLPPELVARVTKIQDTFKDVDQTPLSKWIEDFSRDEHPESEIAIYEAMARAYSGFCRDRSLSLIAKQEVYGVVILRSASPDAEVLKATKPSAITVEDVEAILKLYDMPPRPVVVAPSQ